MEVARLVNEEKDFRFLGLIHGGLGGMALNFWPGTFFPKNFHTPNIKTDVEKQNKSIYYSNEF